MRNAFYTLILLFICTLGLAQTNVNTRLEQESTAVQKIKVFPNPATNVVTILGLKNSIKADIHILDVYGNLMIKHQWAIKNNALNIPITRLRAGIYFVTIISAEQKVKTKFYKK
ncbi:MAG: T9SS type A sorting domain-containing protein [Maribacter sp.]|nr:T9SS type A sorting domain-containing protein [Maribacter sp.]